MDGYWHDEPCWLYWNTQGSKSEKKLEVNAEVSQDSSW